MTLADGDATAAFVLGRYGVRWVAGIPGYGAAAITADVRIVSSPPYQAVVLRAGASTADDAAPAEPRWRQPVGLVPLDPGAAIGVPAAQAGQVAGPGSHVGTWSVQSASAG